MEVSTTFKGDDSMTVMTRLEIQSANAKKYLEYFEELQKNNPEEAKAFAVKELINIGVLNSDGTRKDKIVSWD